MSRGRHEGSVEARLLRPGVGCWVPLADVSRVRDAALGFARAEHLGGLVRSDETQVESGDGIALGARRRTRLDQVAPAIAALGRHGLAAFMFFMYGFPGETRESLAATRRLARSLNDGHESAPVVLGITHTEFRRQALAGVRQRGVLNGPHRYDYEHLEVTPSEAI
jgi:hypothetical protein